MVIENPGVVCSLVVGRVVLGGGDKNIKMLLRVQSVLDIRAFTQ